MSRKVVYAKYALKDAKRLAVSGLKPKAAELLAVLEQDPFQIHPHSRSWLGTLAGAYSRRFNVQHRIVYEVFAKERVVQVFRMWTHYE